MISLAKVRRAVLVVAHPDDESLWAGGLVAHTALQGVAWTVLCCTIPRRDPIRADLFHSACGRLGARWSKVLGPTEPAAGQEIPNLSGLLARATKDWFRDADLIVTHGAEGEYGHVHHRQVHRELAANADGLPLVTIGYRREGAGAYALRLSVKVWHRKLFALQAYSHELPFAGRVMPKWQALLENYGSHFDLRTETYDNLTD